MIMGGVILYTNLIFQEDVEVLLEHPENIIHITVIWYIALVCGKGDHIMFQKL